jgi:hypothetical protein
MFATLRRPFASLAGRTTRGKKRRERAARRPGLEALEDRQLLSASPFVFTTLDDRNQPVAHQQSQAQALVTSPMMNSVVRANDLTNQASDFFKVHLTQGQILTAAANVTTASGAKQASSLALVDAGGNTLAASFNGVTASPDLAYRVPADGDYFVEVSTAASATPANYTLSVRPVGLSPTLPDLRYLDTKQAELDVFLVGNPLEFTGLAGHGFGIRGDWQQTVTGTGSNTASSYTVSGPTYLETAAGEVALPSTSSLSVTTRGKAFGAYVGELKDFNAVLSFPLTDFAKALGPVGIFGLAADAALSATPIHIGLGKDIATTTGAPVLGDVPYLYFSGQASGSLDFGGVHVALGGPGGVLPSLNVVADPADPYLYIGATNLPGPVPSFTFGGSADGLIPFNPAPHASHAPSKFYGNLLWGGVIDFTLAGAPVKTQGETVFNLDAAHTGKPLGGLFANASDLVANLGNPADGAQLAQAFRDISFESSGAIDLTLPGGQLFAHGDLPLAQGTAFFDGPNQRLAARGEYVGPFQGTSLAQYLNPQFTADAFVNLATKQFDVKLNGGLSADGYGGSATLDATNSRVAVSADLNLPTGDVKFKGAINPDGSFLLKGDAPVNFYLGTADAAFTLSGDAQGHTTFTIAADLMALGTDVHLSGAVQPNGDFDLTGHAASNFYIGNGTGDFTFSEHQGKLSMSVDGTLNIPNFLTVTLAGIVNPDGTFDLQGQSGVNYFIGSTTTNFDLIGNASSYALDASGSIDILGSNASITGHIDSSGNVYLHAHGDSNFYVGNGSVDLELDDVAGSVTCGVNSQMTVLGSTVDLTGSADWNALTLTGAAPVNFYIGTADTNFTLMHSNLFGITFFSATASLSALDTTFNMSGLVFSDGSYNFTGSANSGLLGLGTASASYTFSSSAATLDAHFHALGQALDLSGVVDPFGNFSFSTGVGVNFGGILNGSASFTFSEEFGVFSLNAHLSGGFNIVVATADLEVNLSIGGDGSGNVAYAGSGLLTFTVLDIPGSLGLSVSNNDVAFSLFGHSFDIPLPG